MFTIFLSFVLGFLFLLSLLLGPLPCSLMREDETVLEARQSSAHDAGFRCFSVHTGLLSSGHSGWMGMGGG